MKRVTLCFLLFFSIICQFGSFTLKKPENEPAKQPTISGSTLSIIKRFEGFKNRQYEDSQGIPTIGVGHQIKSTEEYLLGAVLSNSQVDNILKRDLRHCQAAIKSSVRVQYTQAQFDAMVSLCHNIGTDQFAKSKVVFYLNEEQPKKAANAFLNWNKPSELYNRRKQERMLFLQDI